MLAASIVQVPEVEAELAPLDIPIMTTEPEVKENPEQDAALEELIRQATATKKKTKEDEKLEAVLEIADEVAAQAEQSVRPNERPSQMPTGTGVENPQMAGSDACSKS